MNFKENSNNTVIWALNSLGSFGSYVYYNELAIKLKETNMKESTFIFRVENDLKSSFSKSAKARDLTGAQLLRNFMRDYVKQQ